VPWRRLSDAGFARRVAIALGVAVLLLFLWRIVDALLLAFGAVLVAVLLRAAAVPLARRTPLPAWSAIPLVALLAVLGVGLVGWLVGAEVRQQVAELVRRLPAAWDTLQDRLGATPFGERLVRRVGDASPDVGGVLAGVTGVATSAAGVLGNLVLVVFGGLYLAAQPRLYGDGLVKLVPPAAQASVAGTLEAIGEALRLWLAGQLLSMAAVAVLTALGLWLLGLPAYLALGLLAGLAEFVPVVGSILAAMPALLLALSEGGVELTAWTLLLYLAIQQLQGNIVQPLVTRRTVSLPPALTLFAIVAFGLVFGPLGVLFAAPLAVVAFVAVKRLWVREALGEATDVPGEGGRG
jgi:predicted PurR-regulated permease PerM